MIQSAKPLVFIAAAVLAGAPAWASDSALAPAPPINAFRQVTADIFRGARPSYTGLQALAQQGIKTDLDLETDPAAIATEQREAAQLGLRFISREMSSTAPPVDSDVNAILAILEDPANYPIFIHCKLGEDRTGLIAALYRVQDQKWAPADAYAEWVQDGFHIHLTNLSNYFEQRTGFLP